MSLKNIFRGFSSSLIKLFLAAEERNFSQFPKAEIKKILVIRQHNQFGDMLASVSLFRALKETYPNSNITLLASKDNYYAVSKNKFIDQLFVFEKKKLASKKYFAELKKILQNNYDLALVPVTVAVSNTSCILCALSDAKEKVGPKSLNGKKNLVADLMNYKVDMDWRKYPDAHVSDFILDIVRPFGIKTKDFTSSITFDEADFNFSKKFIESYFKNDKRIIGFHVGAAKPQNRWNLNKYVELIKKIIDEYNPNIYFTGSNADKEQIEFMKEKFPEAGFFLNNTIPQLAALISLSSLFITNDTGVMHVAGTSETPQISIFGPTNPFNWAPLGSQKYFIKKTELIDDILVEDVFNLVKFIL